MQVHCGEGVAIHTGPESCGGRREAYREALTGERAGRPLSRDSPYIGAPTPSRSAEGDTDGRASASAGPAPRGQRPRHARTLLARERGDLSE